MCIDIERYLDIILRNARDSVYQIYTKLTANKKNLGLSYQSSPPRQHVLIQKFLSSWFVDFCSNLAKFISKSDNPTWTHHNRLSVATTVFSSPETCRYISVDSKWEKYGDF